MTSINIPSQYFSIVLIADLVYPRVCKIGYGLRSAGWTVVLFHRDNPRMFVDDVYQCFDQMYAYSTPDEALKLAFQMPGSLFHIFSVWNFDVAGLFIHSNPGKVVFDDWDVIAGMVSDDYADSNYPGQRILEKYCFENADGVCSKCLEPQYARKYLKYSFKADPLFLLDSCWDFPDAELLQPQRQEELHIVYVGSVNIEKHHPQGSTEMGDFYLDFAKDLASSGIHFHIYPNPFRCNNFADDYSEYIDLSLSSPFFHFHDPLPNDRLVRELTQYDIGLITDYSSYFHPDNIGYNVLKYYYCGSNKIYDYMDAGLGILIGDCKSMHHFLERRGVGVFTYLEDVKQKLLSEPPTYWKKLKQNALKAKQNYSIKKHAARLIEYYISVFENRNIPSIKQKARLVSNAHKQNTGGREEHVDNEMINYRSIPLVCKIQWNDLKKLPYVRLYAGDIPKKPGYDGLVGLTLNNSDATHIQHDITQPFPLEDNSVDSFQAEDVFEHISYDQLPAIINEIYRVLKPGGLFRLSVPDYGCDILRKRSYKNVHGDIIFDPKDGGNVHDAGHIWFPRINNVSELLNKTLFAAGGSIDFLHYWNTDKTYVTKQIDYSKGFIQRSPDFDRRVQEPYRPMSIVVDLVKGSVNSMPMNNEDRQAKAAVTVKISFIMIVLNGMPFVEYALKAIYEEAHEIIIVEGAVDACMFAANPDGSSVDGTVELIRSFPDPLHKIKLIQGRWPEKCEMQNAALEHVTGNYVWLVDSDEVYRKKDLAAVRTMLVNNPDITQMNFIPDNFWKGFDYLFVSPHFFEPVHHYRRLFKYKPGTHFTSHRPPTMVWPGYTQTTEEMNLVDGLVTRQMGIIPCHYSYVLESQVIQKIELYRRYGWEKGWGIDLDRWYREFFLCWTPENCSDLESLYPIWTGDPGSYSQSFTGDHPEVMTDIISSVKQGNIMMNSDWRKLLFERLRPATLIPDEYIELYCQLASYAIDKPGDILEIGVYRGGSLFRLAEFLLDHHSNIMDTKRLIGIDTFQGHPYSEPGVDPEHHPVGRFSDTVFSDVKRSLAVFPFVDVLVGNCLDVFATLPGNQQFCLVNIDVDVKKSAIDALNYVYPRLTAGGIIIFDEFQGYGQEMYIREFFRDKPVKLLPRTGLTHTGDYGLIALKLAIDGPTAQTKPSLDSPENASYSYDVYFDLNNGCNLSCIMCGGKKNAHDQHIMSVGDFSKHIVPLLAGSKHYQFGCMCEPLMVPYFRDAVAMLPKPSVAGPFGRIVTNGTLLSPLNVAAVVDSGVFQRIMISFDGATPQTLESIRRGAKFEKLVENVSTLVTRAKEENSNISIELLFTIMRENYYQLPDMVRLAAKLGVHELKLHKLSPYDVAFVDDDFFSRVTAAISEARYVAQQYSIGFTDPGYVSKSDYEQNRYRQSHVSRKCNVAATKNIDFMIDCYGQVTTPCSRPGIALGNILQNTIQEIALGQPFKALIWYINNPDENICATCHLYVEDVVCSGMPTNGVPLQNMTGAFSADAPMMFHVIEAIRTLKSELGTSRIFALETGTIRSYDEKHESTRYLSEALGSQGHLVSVDCNPDSIRISRDICNDANNVTWIESLSTTFLESAQDLRLHFALLDSANDKDIIFQEFRLVVPLMLLGGVLMIDDAGVKTDKTGFDATGAEKGHAVWQLLEDCGAYYSVLETPHGHGTQIKIIFDTNNKRTINDALQKTAPDEQVSPLPNVRKGVKIAEDYELGQNLTKVNSESVFAATIKDLFGRIKPTRIIETGTYHGEGTTRVIAQSLRDLVGNNSIFYSIECNPVNFEIAISNLSISGLLSYVKPLNGLSLPRHLLPTREVIEDDYVQNIEFDDVFIDHRDHNRAELYYNETNFKNVPDNLLGKCLEFFSYAPDFVLLDSGGHIGYLEFTYLLTLLRAPCYIALDDIYHIKHHKSFLQIQSDPRFTLVAVSDEKFGFCIAYFVPDSR